MSDKSEWWREYSQVLGERCKPRVTRKSKRARKSIFLSPRWRWTREIGSSTLPVASVRRAIREGLAVVLATGRRYRTTRRVMDQLGLKLPAVCLRGTLVKSDLGETLHGEPFSSSQIAGLLAFARRRGQALILQRDSEGRVGPDFVVDAGSSWNAPTRYYMELEGKHGARDAAPEETGCDDVLVVGAFGDSDELRQWRRTSRRPASSPPSWSSPNICRAGSLKLISVMLTSGRASGASPRCRESARMPSAPSVIPPMICR